MQDHKYQDLGQKLSNLYKWLTVRVRVFVLKMKGGSINPLNECPYSQLSLP